MDKIRKILGVIIVIALLLSSSVPFITQIATAAEGEGGMATKAEPIEVIPCEACGIESKAEPIEITPCEAIIRKVEAAGNTIEGLENSWDLEAEEVYLSTQPDDWDKLYVVDVPTVGQEVYLYFQFVVWGSGSTPTFRTEIRLDGSLYCYLQEPLEGGYIYTFYCTSPWTATGGSHTLTGILDVYNTVSESDESNNEASKNWNTTAPFDLEAIEAYLSTQLDDWDKLYVVDVPTVGQEVYFHFKFRCVGSGTTPSFRSELKIDGTMFGYVEGTATGGYITTMWCISPWTATAGSHTLTGVVDVNNTVSESDESNNEASKDWTTPGGAADIWLDKTSLYFAFTEAGAAVAQSAPAAGAATYGTPGTSCEACSGVGREATAAEQELLEAIRKAIEERGAQWEANITAVSGLSLEAKKQLCGLKLSQLPEDIETVTSSLEALPSAFDWRDKDGIDWMTSVKEQICGTCWCFGTLGSLEAVINIDKNDPDIDMDLSEQRILSCCPNFSPRCGGIDDMALIYDCLKLHGGTPNEACFPYGCPARRLP